jgi:hypothetical protein
LSLSPVVLLLLLLPCQGMDGSGGWGNFSGVPFDGSGWVTQLGDNMKAGTMMIRWGAYKSPTISYRLLKL